MKELCEARAKLEMSSHFQIYPWGVNLTPLPLVSNFHDNFTDLIGLSFLFIEMKELCEARAKLEMSSHFQIYPWGGESDPPPLVSNFHNNFTDLIGLSFLFIEMKELCEARAKLEMSSHFQIYPWGVNLTPLPLVSNFHNNFTDLIGLSFLFIEMKELC